MAWKVVVRSITLVAAVCCLGELGAAALADELPPPSTVVTTSPASLSFGVPSVNSISAAQQVTISVTGTGTATVSGINIANTPQNDYSQTNTCAGPITAPGACTISVTFTAKIAGLRSATLNFSYTTSTSVGTITPPGVALTGAAGAFKLFTPIFIADSTGSPTDPNPVSFGSQTITLTVTPPLNAVLSSSPDGVGKRICRQFLGGSCEWCAGLDRPSPRKRLPWSLAGDADGDFMAPDCFTEA